MISKTKLKELAVYKQQKVCDLQSVFVIEGVKLCEEALAAEWQIKVVCATNSWLAQHPVLPHGTEVFEADAAALERLSSLRTPNEVWMLVQRPVPQMPRGERLVLAVDHLQDPGNLGTILRAADAFDVPVILADGCADPYGEKTVRATMGAVFRRPPVQAATEEILAQCGAKQLPICVTALSDRAEDVRRIELASCVTVIGSEGQGVSEAFLSAASREAIIPMSPRCESLNAAVAATVILWELRRDR